MLQRRALEVKALHHSTPVPDQLFPALAVMKQSILGVAEALDIVRVSDHTVSVKALTELEPGSDEGRVAGEAKLVLLLIRCSNRLVLRR